jgi:hypothetical protein
MKTLAVMCMALTRQSPSCTPLLDDESGDGVGDVHKAAPARHFKPKLFGERFHAGAGSEIPCPTCSETITIPEKSTRPRLAPPPDVHAASLAPSAMASSAAAKVEFHLKVPVRTTPGESLIKKTAVPLKPSPRARTKKIRVRTMRHDKCIDAGHDKFDEMVTKVLGKSASNLIGIHTISYEHFDVQTQKVMTDYGLVIIYRG